LLKWGAVVGGDPFGEFEEGRGDEGLGVYEVAEEAEGEVALGLVLDAEDGAGGGAIAKGDADAAAGEDLEVFRDGVVEDELGGTVDENASGERHFEMVSGEWGVVKSWLRGEGCEWVNDWVEGVEFFFLMWYEGGEMDDELRLVEVEVGSGEYEDLLSLRYAELRAPLGLEWSEGDLEREKEERHFGLYLEGRAIGVMVVRDLGGGVVKLRQIAIARDLQGKGYGCRLMELIGGRFNEEGVREFELHSRVEVAGFYEKMGYVREGELFEEIGIPHVKMRKSIRSDG